MKIAGQEVHPSLTVDKVGAAVKRQISTLDDPGFCVACGNEQGGCEPDARKYECEACGARQVYGAAELFMHLAP